MKKETLKVVGICVGSVLFLALALWALIDSQDKMNAHAIKQGKDALLIKQIHEKRIKEAQKELEENLKKQDQLLAKYNEYRLEGKVDMLYRLNEFGEKVSQNFTIWGVVPDTYLEIEYKDKVLNRIIITSQMYGKTVYTKLTGSSLNVKFDKGETKEFVGVHKLGSDSIVMLAETRLMFNISKSDQMDIGIPFSDSRGNRTVEVLTFNLTKFNKIKDKL